MLQLLLYVSLAAFFVLELTFLRIVSVRQSSKELKTIQGIDTIKEIYPVTQPANVQLVANKIPSRQKDL